MRLPRLVSLLIGSLLFAGCGQRADLSRFYSHEEPGRYQLVATSAGAVVKLDTATGRAWSLHRGVVEQWVFIAQDTVWTYDPKTGQLRKDDPLGIR